MTQRIKKDKTISYSQHVSPVLKQRHISLKIKFRQKNREEFDEMQSKEPQNLHIPPPPKLFILQISSLVLSMHPCFAPAHNTEDLYSFAPCPGNSQGETESLPVRISMVLLQFPHFSS